MLGLRRGSKFGSEPAEARPSLAMMIINVKNPKTPTRRSMKTRCFHEKDVRFPPVRFLKRWRKKNVKKQSSSWYLYKDLSPVRKQLERAPVPVQIVILTWGFEQTNLTLVVVGTCHRQSQSVWRSCDQCPECRRSFLVMMLENKEKIILLIFKHVAEGNTVCAQRWPKNCFECFRVHEGRRGVL